MPQLPKPSAGTAGFALDFTGPGSGGWNGAGEWPIHVEVASGTGGRSLGGMSAFTIAFWAQLTTDALNDEYTVIDKAGNSAYRFSMTPPPWSLKYASGLVMTR